MKIVIFLSFLVGNLIKALNSVKRKSKKKEHMAKGSPHSFMFLKKVLELIRNFGGKIKDFLKKIMKLVQCFFRKVCEFFKKMMKLIRCFFRKVCDFLKKTYYAIKGMIDKLKKNIIFVGKEIFTCLRKNKYFDVFVVGVEIFSGNNSLRFYRLESMKEMCQRNKNSKYSIIEKEKERTVCVAEYWKKSEKRIEKYLSDETYIAQIENATIVGATNIVISKDCFFSDMLCKDDEKRIDLRDGVLKKVIDTYVIVEESSEIKECKCAISLVGGASYNYYHLLIEILPKLLVAERFEEYRRLPVLVDDVVFKVPQFKQIFGIVNKYNHPVIEVKSHEKWNVENLIYVSGHSWMPINLYNRNMMRTSDFRIAEEYLYSLRERLLENIKLVEGEQTEKKKYFVSRKNTQTVRLKNEEIVRSIFEKNGYIILYPEELTFEEQIQCFYNAACIVAASGAALTNIIFCQPGTQIVCLIPKEFEFHMYSTIAHMFSLEPVFLDCEVVERTPWPAMDLYEADIKYIKEFVEFY